MKTQERDTYLIIDHDRWYWQQGCGWVYHKQDATVFTETEYYLTQLPANGRWIANFDLN